MTRTIDTIHGEAEYVVGQVTEKTGKDLASATFKCGLGTNAAPPATWVTPDVLAVDGATAKVSLLVNSSSTKGEHQWLWVQVIDNPETYNLRCVREDITVL